MDAAAAAAAAIVWTAHAHARSVTALAVASSSPKAPSLQRLYTGGRDRSILAWSLDSLQASDSDASAAPQPIRICNAAHRAAIWALTLSPDSSLLFSGGEDSAIVARDSDTLAPLRSFAPQATEAPLSVVFALESGPAGDVLYSGGMDNCITIWDVESGARLGILEGHSGSVNAIAASPCGGTLFSGASDGKIIVWDVNNRSIRTILKGHSAWVDTIVLSKDGRYLFSGGGDGRILKWDTAKGTIAETFEDERVNGCVKALALSANGSTLFSAGAAYGGTGPALAASVPGVITIWDVADGGGLVHQMAHHKDAVSALAFYASDGKGQEDSSTPARGEFLVSTSFDKSVAIWNVTPVLHDMQRAIRQRVTQLGIAIDSLVIATVNGEKRLRIARAQSAQVERVCASCCISCVLDKLRSFDDVGKAIAKTEGQFQPRKGLRCLLCGTRLQTGEQSRLTLRTKVADLVREAAAVVYEQQKLLTQTWKELEATTDELQSTYRSLISRQ